MGYTTDFIGHIEVTPPLNHDEQQYLTAFGDSRRFDRDGGGYEVPFNPAAENRAEAGVELDRCNAAAPGQPSLWCGWTPGLDGECLSFDGHEKFDRSTEWMRYLIDHFLRPGALAERSTTTWFRGFTFDHALDGVVAACERDSHRLYLIRVEDNVVTEEELWPHPGEFALRGALPYEVFIEEWDART